MEIFDNILFDGCKDMDGCVGGEADLVILARRKVSSARSPTILVRLIRNRLTMTVTFRVFKKSSLNGKVTIYLGRRDFVDHVTSSDPVDGVLKIDNEFLNDKKITVQLVCSFRYGREDDETMGLNFKKELVVDEVTLFPEGQKEQPPTTRLQERLLNKLGQVSKRILIQKIFQFLQFRRTPPSRSTWGSPPTPPPR